MRPTAWLLPVLAVACSGCYPIYKTLQPSASATVLDATSHAPLGGATVQLISNAYPYGVEKSREAATTDVVGRVTFESRREWRWEVLMIHGAEVFFWNWCVAKPGFETVQTTWQGGDDFVSDFRVELKAGDSTPCGVKPNVE